MKLYESNEFHGEAFNFGPPSNQIHSVGELVLEMSKYWDQVKWNDLSSEYQGPYESNLLKLNCDKALYYLKWHAIWDFEETVKNTSNWYKEFYENKSLNITDISTQQILEYTAKARKNKLEWAL